MSITNKTVVITGANRGIGLEWARQILARPGNRVIAGVRHPDKAQDLKALSPGIRVLALDVSKTASIKAFATELKGLTPHVDVLINNAGVYGERLGFGEESMENMVSTFTANTAGPMVLIQELYGLGLLGGAAGPSLVAILTSKMGSIADASTGSFAYRASKTAVNMLGKVLANELGPQGITVTLLHPGYVVTDMTGGRGLIDTTTSVKGMLSVLESGRDLNGQFIAWDDKSIPW